MNRLPAVNSPLDQIRRNEIAINQALTDTPEKVNSDPYGEAWMIKIEITNPGKQVEPLDAAG